MKDPKGHGSGLRGQLQTRLPNSKLLNSMQGQLRARLPDSKLLKSDSEAASTLRSNFGPDPIHPAMTIAVRKF